MVSPTHLKVMYLADLSEDKAFEYYQHLLNTTFVNQLSSLVFLDVTGFRDNVFSVVGGRMLHIHDFLSEAAWTRSIPTGIQVC